MNIAFRVDANKKIGGGHFQRCLNFAKIIKNKNRDIYFISRNLNKNLKRRLHNQRIELINFKSKKEYEIFEILKKNKIDDLVIDHYSIKKNLEKKIKNRVKKLIVFDDKLIKHFGHLIINNNFLNKNRCTLLGVGPMSLNCVDAAIELANEYEAPLLLIASRRQIDSEEFGGGYVNNWTTAEFARYVIDRDKKGKILLARDHGGPWQSILEKEAGFGLRRAMESAKSSYRADIEAGFQVLHIDPSVDIHGQPKVDEVLDRVFDLYEFCWSQAQKNLHRHSESGSNGWEAE
jgi:hypothetical protein